LGPLSVRRGRRFQRDHRGLEPRGEEHHVPDAGLPDHRGGLRDRETVGEPGQPRGDRSVRHTRDRPQPGRSRFRGVRRRVRSGGAEDRPNLRWVRCARCRRHYVSLITWPRRSWPGRSRFRVRGVAVGPFGQHRRGVRGRDPHGVGHGRILQVHRARRFLSERRHAASAGMSAVVHADRAGPTRWVPSANGHCYSSSFGPRDIRKTCSYDHVVGS